MPVVNNKVKILVNGEKMSVSPDTSQHARYINFIGEEVPEILENNNTDTFDINLEAFVNKIIDKKMEKYRKEADDKLKVAQKRLNRTLVKKNAD
jgi:hypothetical protein